jgi:hypothetical protein
VIPAGYLTKLWWLSPPWFPAERVSTIYWVSVCISHDFADCIEFWPHNGYWLFDSPEVIVDVARRNRIEAGAWTAFAPDGTFGNSEPAPHLRGLRGRLARRFGAVDAVTICVSATQ